MSEKRLKETYYDPESAGSFGGVKRLRATSRQALPVVKNWLKDQDVYTLHKPARIHFPRRRTIVGGIRDQYQCDLIDVQKLKRHNDGYGFILTCIDVFTKVAGARPLKNKTSTSIVPALKSIFKELGRPEKVQTDKGSEFFNRPVQKFLREINVHHFNTENETIKASIVERWNRTLKDRLWRYFTHTNNVRYVNVLPKVVKAYNNSYHRSIKRKPVDVTLANQEEVWQTLYGTPRKISERTSLRPGDRVRISKTRHVFKKGYLPSWSEELFTVSRVHQTTPRTYVIKDDHGEELIGSFYSQELQRVGEKEVYRIEEVLRERKTRRGKEVLVKWLGYPTSFNSWIPKSNITHYNA